MNPGPRALDWSNAMTLSLVGRLNSAGREDRDRGDVPGWVMITVMTAIVVIALLGVFRDQAVSAVQSAFQSVTGSG